MELRHLRYFIKAAELLHFTRAAEALYVSQPTLSTHIQQLEQELGTELFARIGRHVKLTEAGELLLVHARQSVRELQQAGEEIDAIKGLLRGNLQIAALPLFSSVLLPGWIAAFNAMHPSVHIQARSGTSDTIESGVVAGSVDLGFAILPVDHPDVNTRELFASQVVVIASRKHPLASSKQLKAEDLDGLPVALATHRVASARLLGQYFERLGVKPQVVVEYDDAHALVNIAKLGSLVTFLPMPGFIEDSDLCALQLPGEGLYFTAVALWSHATPASKAFLEIATMEAKKFPAASEVS